MTSDNIETTANIATIWVVLQPIIIGAVAGGITSFGYMKFFRNKETRLINNWKRPIGIIPSKTYSMDNEKLLLEKSSFFDNVNIFAPEANSVDNITDKYRLVILRYEQNSDDFWHVYEQLAVKGIPTIIYAEQGKILPYDFPKIQKYTFHAICNTPVRLIGDVASIMSTYPSSKELK